MTPADRQRDDYERELLYLRNAGAAFARANPTVAARLELSGDQCPDPHVERLLEGFAFLAARLGRRIDDSVSALAGNLLEQLYPHATRPLPSASVAHFDADPAKVQVAGGYSVERGSTLFADTADGASIYLRTTAPLVVWPLRVDDVDLLTDALESMSGHPGRRSVLSVRLACPATFVPRASQLGTLRFYVKGGGDNAARLCDLLYAHTVEVRWRTPGAEPVTLDGVLPRFAGCGPDDALLPERNDTYPGLRLLLEYFAFPLKFQFFDLDCSALGPPDPVPGAPGSTSYELLFVLGARPAVPLEPEPDALQLGCVPVVNLFPRTSEPVRINGTSAQYKLVADGFRERATEIYSIEQVASSAPGQPSTPVAPYFSWHGTAAGAPPVYWHAQRGPAFKSGLTGSDMLLTFVDPAFDPALPATRSLVARLLCTNRGLAEALPAGLPLAMEDAGAVAAITLLHKPSAQSQAAPDGAARWKLVSQLSLNHLSLAEGPGALAALKELLVLNNVGASVVAEAQIDALARLACERVTRYVRDDPWHGYRHGYLLTLWLGPRGMRGASALLFGAVLHRFLAQYAGINTFVELSLRHDDGRELFRWSALPSAQLSL